MQTGAVFLKAECVACFLASLAVISEYMQSETCLSPQHFCEAREALLMPFTGREVTAQRCKCVQALHLCWAEWGDQVQGIGWEGVGRSPVPLALSCPSAQTLLICRHCHFWEQDMKMSCQAFSPAGIWIVCAVVLLHKLFLADRESGWNFSELHLLPASTAGLLSPLPGATLHHGSLCIRCTHSRTLASAGCSCNTDSRQL